MTLQSTVRLGGSAPSLDIESDPQLTGSDRGREAFRRGIRRSATSSLRPALSRSQPLALGDKFLRTIFVISYPRYISVGWFAPIINLNFTFDVSISSIQSRARSFSSIEEQGRRLEAQIISDSERAGPRSFTRNRFARHQYLRMP
jgi:hypothetical protein